MRGRRVAAGVFTALVAMPALAFPSGGAGFGNLEVSGDDWTFAHLVGPNYTADLFAVPGDVDGDGYDDLVAWTDNFPGRQLFLGPIEGAVLGGAYHTTSQWRINIEGCVPWDCALRTDPVWPPSRDSRPVGVDPIGNGRAPFLIQRPWGEYLGCPPGERCPLDELVSVSNATSTDHWRQDTAYTRYPGEPRAFGAWVGATRDGGRPAVLVEESFDRSAAGEPSDAASTRFSLVEFDAMLSPSDAGAWMVSEPVPLSLSPRPPHFLAAPDFDGDGLADIVTWSPPAPGASGLLPGVVSIYNGTANGLVTSNPMRLTVEGAGVLLADLNGDGHTDIATYHFIPPQPTGSSNPLARVAVLSWSPGGFLPMDAFDLAGPSIFPGQPPVRLQAGDVDGDGIADLVAMKYDTTSASAGHLLVDAFLARRRADCDLDARTLCLDWNLAFSSEIALSGSDIYTNEAGLRLNLQGDFDGDGRRDITVGYFGGNAPERGRTSTSGFVAVLYASTALHSLYTIWIDTDPGLAVHPVYRNYTIHIRGWKVTDGGVSIRISLTNATDPSSTALRITIDLAGPTTWVESDEIWVDGPVSLSSVPLPGGGGLVWSADVPIRFNWSFAPGPRFGLEASFLGSATGAVQRIFNPMAGRYDSAVQIAGAFVAESEGRTAEAGGWARAGPVVNFTNLSLVFAGLPSVQVPPDRFQWVCLDGAGTLLGTYPGGVLSGTVSSPTVTTRGVRYGFGIAGAPSAHLASRYSFSLNFDADPPQFGAHLPLESEWVTSTPTFVAVDIFDNESGVDPDRIEYSWENDGAPFIRWDRATALPGQTAAEVVGQALILFPEGNLSNVIWRVWDRVGNGPAKSPIFGVKVDTTGITFRNPRPPAAEWQNSQSVIANVEILSGSSGVYRDSVEYRGSTGGLFNFGPWITAPTLSSPLDPTFVATTALVLEEGDANWVQWRADSNARVGLRLSDPFQIRVDSLRPIIVTVQPNETSIFPYGPVPLSLSAHEGSPAGVAQRGLDTSASGATFRIKGPADPDFGRLWPLPLTDSSPDGWSASFANSAPFERGNSSVEFTVRENGGRTVTALTTVRVNQPPTVTIESTPPNFTVAVLANLTLNATALDPEGQPLRYLWSTCAPPPVPSPRPVPPPPPLSRNASVTLSADAPEALRTATARAVNLCLVVRDSMDGEARINVTVYVVVPPPPEPPLPPPTTPQVTVPTADAGFAAVVLVIAAAVAALALLLRRRRAPPDKV